LSERQRRKNREITKSPQERKKMIRIPNKSLERLLIPKVEMLQDGLKTVGQEKPPRIEEMMTAENPKIS